jgi:hypothetical protein
VTRTAASSVAFAVACVLAGVLAAAVLADSPPPPTTTGTTTTTTTATTTAPTTTAPAPAALPAGVTIAGVPVGGLPKTDAYAAVRAAFATPVVLVVAGRRVSASPELLGAVGYAQRAVSTAGHAAPGQRIPLEVSVRPGPLRRYLRALAARLDRKPVDARLSLRNGKPWVTKERPGFTIEQPAAARAIAAALASGRRSPLVLPLKTRAPAVTRATIGPVVVIHRGANRLNLYTGMRPVRTFEVATGQSAYPTPLGRFAIIVKWKNPWWYPPA